MSKSLVCFWNLLPGSGVACQAFFDLQSKCCISVHLPQGEKWKINEKLRKAHFQGYRDWEGNENWEWRKRFKLSALSSSKSYKWGVNVNILTQKWKTTKELFREGLDLNYNTQDKALCDSFMGICSCLGCPNLQPSHMLVKSPAQLSCASISFLWGRTTYFDPNVFSLILLRHNIL